MFEGRIVDPSPPPRALLSVSRGALPARGTRVSLVEVELPALEPGLSPQGNSADRTRSRRANRAQRVYRLVRLDGAETGSGLFDGVEVATAYAKAHGWRLES